MKGVKLMAKKFKIKLFVSGIVVLCAGILIYQLLWGKLFPYSPVVIGFSKHELPNSVIYIQNGAVYNDLGKIDTLIRPVEEFHQLKFVKKPRIFVFLDSANYIQRSTSKARFCTFYDNTLVISPWALKESEEGKISLVIYLKHELSHVLLMQHMGILNAYKYPEWLLEGIAVYSTNQMGTSFYPGKEETYSLIRKGIFMPPEYFKTGKEDEIKLDVKFRITFMYSEFACIVDYLVTTYGKDKLLNYMKELFKDSDNDKVFNRIYGINFHECISDFRNKIKSE